MLRAAVIGVGSMGKHHARVYWELEGVDLTAVADMDDSRLNEVAGQYNTIAYLDYREMLQKEKLDLVSIVVPTKDHYQVAKDCFSAGVHVLIEKPIASTVERAQQIIQLARDANRKLMIGHIMRFNPAVQELKKQLDEGKIGRIFQITCRREGPFPKRIRDVGVAVDLAPHDIDIVRYLSGSEPSRIFAEMEHRIHTEYEDLLLASMRLKNGVISSFIINWLTPTKIREVIVHGEKGMFRLDDLSQDLYFYENSLATDELWDPLKTVSGVNPGRMERFHIDRKEPLKMELRAFIDSILNDRNVPVTGEDGLEALKIALLVQQSGLTQTIIEL